MSTTQHRHKIEPLRHQDLRTLRLHRHFRFDSTEVGSMLTTNPGASFWIPDTDELILVGNWRHRPDLHVIHALVATNNESALIEQAADHARQQGATALLMVDMNETRRPAFYARNGFRIIDRIATYELNEPAALARQFQHVPGPTFARVRPGDVVAARQVEELDHLAFPWFWWNVADELETYLNLPDVEVWIGVIDSVVVSYIGFTNFGGWGHLDRIATHPERQRAGIGTASLNMAINLMRDAGAHRIALSTQGLNLPAQRMYQRRGFFRTPMHDYVVHGIVLDARIETEQIDLAQIAVPPVFSTGERNQ